MTEIKISSGDNNTSASSGSITMSGNSSPSNTGNSNISSGAGTSGSASTVHGNARIGATGASAAETIENAVFTHIQAIRALGKTSINTLDISQALSIPESEVIAILPALIKRGVRIAA